MKIEQLPAGKNAQEKLPSLVICIVMDIIGYGSYAIPFLGEFFDIIWAPFSAFVFYSLFGSGVRTIGAIVNFIEELAPGFDFIPSFTIGWFWARSRRER
jgi:hypothetical protein